MKNVIGECVDILSDGMEAIETALHLIEQEHATLDELTARDSVDEIKDRLAVLFYCGTQVIERALDELMVCAHMPDRAAHGQEGKQDA